MHTTHGAPVPGSLPWSHCLGPFGSSLHVAEQPSPLFALPSSHCSPAFAFSAPSPHFTLVQSASQLPDAPPVSQSSPAAAFTTPSPHFEVVQFALHCADGPLASHCSTPAYTAPSPHVALSHELRHASVLLPLPSSHCSPGSTFASPQVIGGGSSGPLSSPGPLSPLSSPGPPVVPGAAPLDPSAAPVDPTDPLPVAIPAVAAVDPPVGSSLAAVSPAVAGEPVSSAE